MSNPVMTAAILFAEDSVKILIDAVFLCDQKGVKLVIFPGHAQMRELPVRAHDHLDPRIHKDMRVGAKRSGHQAQ